MTDLWKCVLWLGGEMDVFGDSNPSIAILLLVHIPSHFDLRFSIHEVPVQ